MKGEKKTYDIKWKVLLMSCLMLAFIISLHAEEELSWGEKGRRHNTVWRFYLLLTVNINTWVQF